MSDVEIRDDKVKAERHHVLSFIETPNHTTGSTDVERAMAMFMAAHVWLMEEHGIRVALHEDKPSVFI